MPHQHIADKEKRYKQYQKQILWLCKINHNLTSIGRRLSDYGSLLITNISKTKASSIRTSAAMP